jgi:hypothetical protein
MPTETLDQFISRRRKETPTEVVESPDAIVVEGEISATPATQEVTKITGYTPEADTVLQNKLNNSNWSDALIAAAIPAVTGALAGYGEEGLKYGAAAGKEVLKEEKDLRTKLLEMQAKRKAAAEGKLYEVDKDGNRIWATREQAIGQGIPTDKKYGKTLEEQIALYNATKGKTSQEYLALNKDKQAEAEANKTIEQFTKDEEVKKSTMSYNKLDALDSVLNSRGWASGIAAQALFIRGVLGEVGNLNEQEQRRAGGSPALTNQAALLLNKFTNGETLTPTDREQLKKITSVMRNHYANLVNSKADNLIRAKKSAVGRDVSPILAPFRLSPTKGTSASKVMKDPAKMSDEELDEFLKSQGAL